MNINLKLIPFMSDPYSSELTFLKIPVLFEYEDMDGAFTQHITEGLPIIGKQNMDSGKLEYTIGSNCSIDQLDLFIRNLTENRLGTVTFSETEDLINAIDYDPSTYTWVHRTGSKLIGSGSTLRLKISPNTLSQFIKSFESYRKLAFMMIKGHQLLVDNDTKDFGK